jgi:hypothetical protein
MITLTVSQGQPVASTIDENADLGPRTAVLVSVSACIRLWLQQRPEVTIVRVR